MLRWLGRTYAKRIVNVNVNIVLAGVLALAPTLLVVHIATDLGLTTRAAEALGINHEWIINAITFTADVFFDVAIYFLLHWLANHWPRMLHLKKHARDKPHLTFFRDATLVQVERMALSPLLYILFLGSQHILIARGMEPVQATAYGFAAGILTARTLHTLWMLRQARRRTAVSKVGEILPAAPAPARRAG